jgi:hypothetical protein
VSINYLDSDISQRIGAYLKTTRIKALEGSDGLKFYSTLSESEDDYSAYLKNNGNFYIKNLEIGKWRYLTDNEVKRLLELDK